MPTKKFLFLYSELAGYFLACLKELHQRSDVEVHLIHWPINKEAPFNFEIPKGIKTYQKSEFTTEGLLELAKKINPDLIFCPGWMDKEYLKVAKYLKNSAVVLGGMDNKFYGKLKQYLARLVAPVQITPHFNYIFVPGPAQAEYAQMLGFKNSQILQGYYSADLPLFNEIYEASVEAKKKNFPHRLIYTGRYYNFKGLAELWQAFAELKEELINDWELWCLGTGDLEPAEHPAIKHFGFIQPDQLREYLINTGVFVLASHKEPWAVTVHEFAAAGFPLLCSSEVGAANVFLEEGKNGFSFRAKDKTDLKNCLRQVMTMNNEDLVDMMKSSHEIAQQISPKRWADTVYNLVENVRN